jgi:hypothetical protein
MSRVAEFSSYVGLVVLISALVLLSPRLTVGAFARFTGWVRARVQDLLAWRPRTVRHEPTPLPVEISVGVPHRSSQDDHEVLEQSEPDGVRKAARAAWRTSRELVELGAVALAVIGILLRVAGSLVDVLPPAVVFVADVGVVVATFLVMQRVIRYYPAELLPSVRFPRRLRPVRVAAPVVALRHSGRLDHALQLVALTVVLLELLTWPGQLAMHLAGSRLEGAGAQLAVGWASELLWLVAIAWVLTWESRPRVLQVTAEVVQLTRPTQRAAPVTEQRAA